MESKVKKLFREESLERISSPERLDQRIQIVSPRAWLPLAALGALVLAALLWSVFGRIPLTVSGQGVLVRPRKVVQFQTPGSGEVVEVKVQVGDLVKKGDVLAILDQSDLRQRLAQQESKLAELQSQNQDTSDLQQRRVQIERQAIQLQRQTLQKNLQDAETMVPVLREKGIESLQRDRVTLAQQLKDLNSLLPTLKERLESRKQLLREQVITSDAVLQAEQEYLSNLAKLSELESQLKQLDLKEANAQSDYLKNLNSIEDIRGQLRDLESRETNLSQQSLETTFNRTNQIKDVSRQVAQLQLQLAQQGQVISEYNGRIQEIAVAPGQILGAGSRLGNIEAEDPTGQLVSIAYFAIQDGKRIQPGMEIQITPSVVKRERYGGIVGQVTSTSSFPVSTQAMSVLLGNEELVKTLAASGAQIQVNATLKEDSTTYSGYEWSSSAGPPLKIAPGTTTQARVKIGELAPISYVIPIFRSLTGVY